MKGLGYSPEEILGLLSFLSLSQVYAALTHALANPVEMDVALQEEAKLGRALTAQHHAA